MHPLFAKADGLTGPLIRRTHSSRSQSQLRSCMKLLNIPLGRRINFNEPKLTDGIHRLMRPGANQ